MKISSLFFFLFLIFTLTNVLSIQSRSGTEWDRVGPGMEVWVKALDAGVSPYMEVWAPDGDKN